MYPNSTILNKYLSLIAMVISVYSIGVAKGVLSTNPELLLLDEVIVCTGTPLSLQDIPIYETNEIEVEYFYYESFPISEENQILSEKVVFTTDVSIWVEGRAENCSTVIEVPIKIIPGPYLFLPNDPIICQDDGINIFELPLVDLSGINAPITFYADADLSPLNVINETIIYPQESTSIFAFATANGCDEILEIPIEVLPRPELFLAYHPIICLGQELDLSTLPIIDLNDSGAGWTFHSSNPVSASNQITTDELVLDSDTVIFAYGNLGQCEEIYAINISISDSFNAGPDGFIELCANSGTYILSDFIPTDVDPGKWNGITNYDFFNDTINTINTELMEAGDYQFEYVVSGNGNCDSDVAKYNIKIMESPNAGEDKVYYLCQNEDNFVNFFDVLDEGVSNNGHWYQLSGEHVNLVDPYNVDFSIYETGAFVFDYIVDGQGQCAADTASLFLSIAELPSIENIEIQCSDDLESYDILFTSNADTVISNYGNVWHGSFYKIRNIPVSHDLELIALDDTSCAYTERIIYPDCDCPFIENAISNGDVILCDGESPSALTVEIEEGTGANWYDAPLGGNLIVENDTIYWSDETELGVYAYYVEVFDLENPDCVSDTRTQILFTIKDKPTANSTSIQGCYSNGLSTFNLLEAHFEISNPDSTILSFYYSISEANQKLNPITIPYVTSDLETHTLYVRVQDYYGCFVIVPIELYSNPNPNFDLEVKNISCNLLPDGGVDITNNESSQILERRFNNGIWSTGLSVGGLVSGNNKLEVRNQFGCVISQEVTIESSAFFDVVAFDVNCSDSGTPSFSDDDVHLLDILVVTDEIGATKFEVINNGISFGTFLYNEFQQVSLPVDGSYYNVEISDVSFPECKFFRPIGTLKSCSNTCKILDANIIEVNCSDVDTPYEPSDDEYQIIVALTGVNNSTEWILHDDELITGLYNTPKVLGPFKIQKGEFTLSFSDKDNPECIYELNVVPPEPCSDACLVELVDFIQTDCNDNFTPTILTDDIFKAKFIARNKNTGLADFYIEFLGEQYGPYQYNETVNLEDIADDGQEMLFTLIDAKNINCRYDFEVFFDPCSICKEKTTLDSIQYFNCEFHPLNANPELTSEGTYEWFNSNDNSLYATSLNPDFTEPGLYTLKVHHNNDCRTESNLELIFNHLNPEIEVSDNVTINCKDTTVTIQAISNESVDILYEWKDVNGMVVSIDSIYVTDIPGTYFCSVLNQSNLCRSDQKQVEIFEDLVHPEMEITYSPSTMLTCRDEHIDLGINDTTEGFDLYWSSDLIQDSQHQITVDRPQEIKLEIINRTNFCSQKLEIEINQDIVPPLVKLTKPDTLNCLKEQITIDAGASSVGTEYRNQWYNAQSLPIVDAENLVLDVTEKGMYFLEIENTETGCTKMDSVTVLQDIEIPLIFAGEDTFIDCNESSVTLNAKFQNVVENYDVNWTNKNGINIENENTLSPTITALGTYYVDAINNINHCINQDSIEVSIDPFTIYGMELYAEDPLCYLDENGAIMIESVDNISEELSYRINNDQEQSFEIFENLAPGEYVVRVTNEEECFYEKQIFLNAPEELFLDLNIENEVTINLGDTLHIIPVTNIPESDRKNIHWSNSNTLECDDCLVNSAMPLTATSYDLLIENNNGCQVETRINVNVTEDIFLFIPNVFNPNTESNNNKFIPLGTRQVKEILSFDIFDRWGSPVYSATNFIPGNIAYAWDGKVNGKPVNAGVYFYVIETELINGKQKMYSGDITVLY